ncbi:max-binding protein MNT-like isoform X2 [Venturia canescens]|uniref:max-binding protein MNT-like isoform X2 n=1 Tax=Venturia canescens TaxID=32260 RepID=UPI001C9D611E|nr:max-binding protein MNT-like isoform X2 [Venturia canescens]
MGVLLMSEIGRPLMSDKNKNQHDQIFHMNVSVAKTALPPRATAIIANGNGLNNEADRPSIVTHLGRVHAGKHSSLSHFQSIDTTSMIGIIDDVKLLPPPISTSVGSTQPPPKKKWIRHYLLEEDPLEVTRMNGNHSIGSRASPVIMNSRGTPPVSGTIGLTVHPHVHHVNSHHQQQQNQVQQQAQPQIIHQHHHHQQQHLNNHNSTAHNQYIENHNSNHSQTGAGQLVVDLDSSHDNKKHRNGPPCVIRSGTREVHNKLEKNRRAHLKECFELLKKQLPAQDEKKSSNLSILHAAIKHIQTLRRKERDSEHEMERLAREKIAAQQRIVALKKELSATWDHIDFSTLLQEPNSAVDPSASKNVSESMDVDVTGLARGGTRYSSTSSLSSAATASSPQNLQTANTTSNIHNQVATAAVVCQTQGLNLAQSSRESPPASSSPGASTPSIPTPAQEKVVTTSANVMQQQQSHQLHLPMLNTSQGLATIVPALQHLGPGLRVIPGDTRQLLVTHTTGNNETRPLTLAVQNSSDQSRPLITVQTSTGSEPRPVALVVHSSAANDNRVTFVHSNLSNNDRPLALAVQSSANEVRPVTFVHSGNEARPLVLATHAAPTLNVTTAQSRMRTGDAQTTHKMVGGVTLVGGNGSELTRLPGGAELNILPANGLTLSHAGVSLQASPGKGGSTVMQTNPSTEGQITHIVGQHAPLSALTPIVTPMTVVSQGNQVTAHILAPTSLAGKMITTPILKSVGQMPLVNAQYINTTTLVKPVVVVSTSSNTSVPSTIPSSTQPSVTTHSSV